ncbi:MAG TPA: PAS domain-containing protein [Rhodocyclaceae bacterium]|nr:PAS domain-containing protein [Rhodocyclaceae bacterium]
MNRSLLPNLKAGLSHLRSGRRASRAGQQCALTERRVADRRHHVSDFRNHEFRLRAAVQVAGFGIYDLDCTTGDNYWSPELAAIAGLPADAGEVALEQVWELVHPDDRNRVYSKVEASLNPQGSRRLEDEFRLVRPDGSIRWIEIRGQTFFADEAHGARILGASGMVVDTTGQRSTEALQREQSEELRLALRVGNSGTFQWDARTREHRWCDEMLALYGLKRGEFGGRDEDWLACLLPEDRAPTMAVVMDALQSGEYDATFRIRRRSDGQIRWMNGRGKVYFDGSGAPVRMVGINVDITESKRVQLDLEETGRRLAVALEASGAVVWEIDLADGIVRGEPRFFTMLGYAPGELPTMADWHALVHEDDRAGVLETVDEVIQGKRTSCRFELRVRTKDGAWRWILSQTAAAERDGGGRARRLVGTHVDIDERKRTEEALQRTSARLQGIMDNAPLLIWIRDLEGRTALANRTFVEALETPPVEQLIGRTAFEIFPRKVAQRLWANDRWALENDAPLHSETTLRDRAGSLHTYLNTTFAVRDLETGKARSMCSICVDITERKAAEARTRSLNAELEERVAERTAELEQANEVLLRTNADLRQFAHATAHDLQTPLRSIAGFTQLLQQEIQGRVDERAEEWASLVVDNTRRLQTLIQELLSYTRLENHGLPVQPVDFRSLVDDVTASLDVLIRETGAEVACSDLPTLPVDRVQMFQVLQNFIENGVKYNRSSPPRISIACDRQEHEWVFSVTDNGIGIEPKHHERIFEIFRRLHAYHEVPGTGIGLALCRRIVERHGGHTWVNSLPGQGSTFFFSLPAGQDDGR